MNKFDSAVSDRFFGQQTEISEEVKARPKDDIPAPPPGLSINPLYIERKTKAINLKVEPSFHSLLKSIAQREGISINALVVKAIKEYDGRHK